MKPGLKTITLRSELRTRFAYMLRLHNLNFYIKKKIIVCIYKDSTVNRLNGRDENSFFPNDPPAYVFAHAIFSTVGSVAEI